MTVDEYLAAVPEPQRTTLQEVRKRIHAEVPGATESISYGIPTIHHEGPLVAFASFQKHCSFFPLSAATIAGLSEELAGYETSKGTIQFAIDQPLPAVLIRKLVKARLKEKK
ncbi:MAG: DUF1801 domain-containing protein [Bryobacteraceae bacterium]|nr:DUF1801 domain-containing protein [Bryobacteraceae bacterium]